MGLLSVLLADLTNLAAESRKRFPAIKEVPKDIMLFLAIFIENIMDVNCKFIFFFNHRKCKENGIRSRISSSDSISRLFCSIIYFS
jgi:hypothetical protein